MKKTILFLLAALGLAACTSQKKTEEAPAEKLLVLYYSQSGSTKAVAEEIQRQLNADIEAIEVVSPYDGDFMQTVARCQQEMAAGESPAIQPLKSDLSKYSTIFLGYPIWCGTYAQPIATLLKTTSFEGKKIVTFSTFGSGGSYASTRDVSAAAPKAEVVRGYGVRTARVSEAAAELNRALIEGGFKKGEIAPLPAWSDSHPVSEEEINIFNAACGDYQFPLGTPVEVATRTTEEGTGYNYTVQSQGPDGAANTTTIEVFASNADGVKPAFIEVMR